MGNVFKISTPEAQGIPSKGILHVLDLFEEFSIPMHSFLLMRHGRLVCEAYWAPYTKDTLQRMYSITKSFVSLAIGALVTKNQLSLDDHIVDFFPDKLTDPIPCQLKETTIRHMLTMSTCHRMTTYKRTDDPDWTRTFFTVPPDHDPGSFFMYDTSSSHVLGALVERITGQNLLEYLRTTVLADAKLSQNAYIIQDKCGVSMGGSGLMATSGDILQTIHSITASDNPYRQYLADACAKQIETSYSGFGNVKDLEKGYGYSIWRFDHESFGFYGMGGQLAIAIPEYDMLIVTTAFAKGIEGGLQHIMDAVWSLIPFLSNAPLPESNDVEELHHRIHGLSLIQVKGNPIVLPLATKWEGNYKLENNSFDLLKVSLHFETNSCTVDLQYAGCTRTIVAGIGSLRVQPWAFDPAISAGVSGAFNDDGVLCISVQFLWPELGIVQLMVSGNARKISLRIQEFMEKEITRISGVFSGEKMDSSPL